MKGYTLISILLITASQLTAQLLVGEQAYLATGKVTIAASTSVLNEGNLTFADSANLVLMDQGTLSSPDQLVIPNLFMFGSDYSVEGNILCSESLHLKGGTLSPKDDAQLSVADGALVTSENEAHISGQLYHQGSGEKFYPLGKNDIYAPITLKGVTSDSSSMVGLEAFNQDLGLTEFPADVKGASSEWYWQINAPQDFSGSKIVLPVTDADAGAIAASETATVLQTDLKGSGTTDLGSSPSSDFFNISSELPAVGPYVLLGFESDLKLKIHNIITPKNDDKNPFLIVDNFDTIVENEVILLDRWGNQVFYERNFTNYARNGNGGRVYDGAFDALPSGNYVCLIKYQGAIKKQMVTVLQE